MRKLKKFVAVLMSVFVLGIAAPQALAGDMNTTPTTPGETNTPPGETSGPPAPGETQGPTLAAWAKIILQILGNSWNI